MYLEILKLVTGIILSFRQPKFSVVIHVTENLIAVSLFNDAFFKNSVTVW